MAADRSSNYPADPAHVERADDRAPTAGPLDVQSLSELVLSYARDTGSWAPLVQFRPGRRWWTRLRGDAQVVWLLSWLEDQATELHDHGGSEASLTVVRGRLDEVRPAGAGRLHTVTLTPGSTRRVPVGTAHDIRNTSSAPAVSIHAYSPPLTRMTYYAPDASGRPVPVRTVVGDEPEAAG